MSTLREVIAEGRRLDEAIAVHLPGSIKADLINERDRFARRHYARLLRVAEAAVEMREAMGEHHCPVPGTARLLRAMDAFDAATGEKP